MSPATITPNIGSIFRAVRSIGVLAIAQPTKRALPTGGVQRPTAKL